MKKVSKQRILESKRKWLHKEHPTWSEAEVGNFMYFEKSDNNTNGLTQCILYFLKYEGCQAERINTTGKFTDNRKIVVDAVGFQREIGSKSWQKGTGTKGSADISATIPVSIHGVMVGLSVKIEVKFGKDRQSIEQKKYEQSINDAGGVYMIVKDMDSFIEWYDNFKLNGLDDLKKSN